MKMNINRSALLIGLFFLTTLVFSQEADDIIGKYRLPNGLDVEIFKTEEEYSGKIIALNGYEDGETKDVKNPDKSKRNEPLIGMIIFKGLKFDTEDKVWSDGNLYGPEKGIYVDLKITEVKDNEIKVVASKYFFHKSLIWKKIKEV